MINLDEIRDTIKEIKRDGSTVGQAEKLALLYIAADYMEREEQAQTKAYTDDGYSRAAAPSHDIVSVEPKSEFLTACDGTRIEDVLMVLDEHMEAIKILYPKEYDALVRKLKELQ